MVKFTCINGYTLNGPTTLLCLADGTWNGDMPECGRFLVNLLLSMRMYGNKVFVVIKYVLLKLIHVHKPEASMINCQKSISPWV